MASHAFESDLEMGGDEVDVTGFTMESIPADASKGLEATPFEEDIGAAEQSTVWRGK